MHPAHTGLDSRLRGNDGRFFPVRAKPLYIAALQWHPEFHRPGSDTIDDAAVLKDFLTAVAAAKIQQMRQDATAHL